MEPTYAPPPLSGRERRREEGAVGVRRVVTGHDDNGRSVIVSDEEIDGIALGERGGEGISVWGRDDTARFPDDGATPAWNTVFPPVGGCRLTIFVLAPGGSDDFDQFVATALAEYAVAGRPGLHRSPTIDFDIVLSGEVVLEVEAGQEITLRPGDVVVQNGTRHRWINRGSSEARVAAVLIGAEHELSQ